MGGGNFAAGPPLPFDMPDGSPPHPHPPAGPAPAAAVVLLSGGLDSATCLAIAQREGFAVHALSFRYGQRHAGEVDAARALAAVAGVARHVVADVDLRVFGGSALTADIPVPKDRAADARTDGSVPVTYVPARNTIFLAYALAMAETAGAGDLFVGVNALDYSGYPDCRPEYIAAFEQMANLATRAGVEALARGERAVRIRTPLLHLTKAQIVRLGTALGVDYAATTSCYDPDTTGAACGHCDACILRSRGFREAGVADPTRYAAGVLAAGRPGPARVYTVRELFHTLQGEGANAGRAAVFCRFTGCNLWTGREQDRATAVCRFCDTEFVGVGPDGGRYATATALADATAARWLAGTGQTPTESRAAGVRPLVVCTGGEPLLQLDAAAVNALHAQGFEVAVETNGTRPAPPGLDWVCVSPKAGAPLVLTTGDELKLVYPQVETEAQPERFVGLPFRQFWLQPMDGPRQAEHTQAAIAYCLAHPRWRLSVQTHKVVGVR